MTNNRELFDKAKKLKPISDETFNEINNSLKSLEAQMDEEFFSRNDIEELIDNKVDLIRDNHANHLRFMLNIMKNYDTFIFINTVSWVLEAYTSRGISIDYWDVQLRLFLKIYKEDLTVNAYNEVLPFYTFLINNYRTILSELKG